MSSSDRDTRVRALKRALGDRARVDADQLEAYAWDYGKLVHRPPAAVVTVHDVGELLEALRIGSELGMPICTRGSGHSQSGQCLADGALVLDMKGLNRVQIDTERGSAWVGGGATWHEVSNATFVEQRLPVGLTMVVDTTVGGTLSVGGMGAESFRTGAQVDQVLELEVATLDGQVVRCSREEQRELFDAVRGGLGQCGVIVQARYPLRRAAAHIRSYMLAYADARALLADMQAIEHTRCDFMFGGFLWTEQTGWQQLLLLGKEFDQADELDDSAVLSGLQFKRELPRTDAVQWRSDGLPGHRFFRRFEEQTSEFVYHPWADHLCEPRAAGELISAVLSEPAVAPRAGTYGGLLRIAAHPQRAPLLMPQASGPLFLFGLVPDVFPAQLSAALPYMQRHNQLGASLGAKRYLSGFLDNWGAEEWSRHFGETWSWFHARKTQFDPHGLLNNGSIRWSR